MHPGIAEARVRTASGFSLSFRVVPDTMLLFAVLCVLFRRKLDLRTSEVPDSVQERKVDWNNTLELYH
jgi:hypothetical protein